MNTMAKLLAGTFVWLLLGTAAFAVTVNESTSQDRDYRVIIDRNPFGLKPPPPPVTNVPAPPTPKDEILLTGITSIGGLKAYFMTKPPQGKNSEFYTLGVDEKKNGLEVLEINTQSKSVRVRNAGLESVMTFAANGVKAPATPSSPVPGGAPGAGQPGPVPSPVITAGVPPPLAGATPGSVGGNSRVRQIPSRNPRTPQMPGAGGFTPNPSPGAPVQAPSPMAAEQDVLLMELQKRANPSVVFPPTPMPQ